VQTSGTPLAKFEARISSSWRVQIMGANVFAHVHCDRQLSPQLRRPLGYAPGDEMARQIEKERATVPIASREGLAHMPDARGRRRSSPGQ
jgi:hypothetical protein